MDKRVAALFFFVLLFSMCAFSADLLVPSQYSGIQSAVNASGSGDRIIVSAGTYTEHVEISKNVIVMSSDPDNPAVVANTIIDAGGSGSAVSMSNGTLSGFTVTGAKSGGIQCSAGNVTVKNCIIRNNNNTASSGKGGGISLDVENSVSALTVINCTFTNNYASGYGGGIFVTESVLNVIGCTFIENSSVQEGGAIGTDYEKTTIKDCVFIENSADYGGAVHNSHYPATISNCTFVNNSANLGGAVAQKDLYLGDHTCRITNCSFYGNIATDRGGAVTIRQSGNMIIRNSILWENIAYEFGPQISVRGGEHGEGLTVSYSCIMGGQADIYADSGSLNWLAGNIDADPLFAGSGSGDLHLKSKGGRWDSGGGRWVVDGNHSPCIDAGDPADPNWVDEPWPGGRRVNMGAYGGTIEASKSLSGGGNIADIDSSGSVDEADLKLLAEKWLFTEASLSENLNGDGIVNLKDFAILARNWGWEK